MRYLGVTHGVTHTTTIKVILFVKTVRKPFSLHLEPQPA